MKLNYLHIKNDLPTLVMLHGLTSSLDTFKPVIPFLEKHFSLLLVDQRGHGKSPPSGSDYSADTMANDLKNLLDELNIKKVSILGHSMGGRTALRFGELHPSMIEKMFIEDMGINQRRETSEIIDREKNELAKKSEVATLHFKSIDEIYEILKPIFSYAKDLLTTKVTARENGFELSFWPHVAVLYGYQGNKTDLTSALTTTTFPVLFLIADPTALHGSVMSPNCIEHIKTHVPRAKLQLISNAGHTIHKSHARELSAAIIDFK